MTPRVSVCITTYKHESYISQAIASVLSQVTEFHYEILVGVDPSDDNTASIVREFEISNPGTIRAFYHDGKDKLVIRGRVTGRRNLEHNLLNAKGEFIVLLDGDDFFIDSQKLQVQVDYLDQNPQFMACYHNAINVDESGRFLDSLSANRAMQPLKLKEVLRWNRIPTMACMFRNQYFSALPGWFYGADMGDWPVHILTALKGDIAYLPYVMSAYRVHDSGLWNEFKVDIDKNLNSQILLWSSLLSEPALAGEYRFIRKLMCKAYERRVKLAIRAKRYQHAMHCLNQRMKLIGYPDGTYLSYATKILRRSVISRITFGVAK